VKPLGPAVLLTARPRARLFHLVFGSHIGRALGADSGEKSGLASDIDTATVESLNALDPKRPIREAVSFSDPEPTFGRSKSRIPPSDGTATLSAGLFKADQGACGARNR
jgi:hypothetical protein